MVTWFGVQLKMGKCLNIAHVVSGHLSGNVVRRAVKDG